MVDDFQISTSELVQRAMANLLIQLHVSGVHLVTSAVSELLRK